MVGRASGGTREERKEGARSDLLFDIWQLRLAWDRGPRSREVGV